MTERDKIRVAKALQGLEFPTSKEQVLAYAEERSADWRTVEELRGLPEGEFGSTEEVEKALPHKPE